MPLYSVSSTNLYNLSLVTAVSLKSLSLTKSYFFIVIFESTKFIVYKDSPFANMSIPLNFSEFTSKLPKSDKL